MRHVSRTLAQALLVLCGIGGLHAQTGGFEGTIVDPSGARVAAAEITITETETGAQRRLWTDSAGRFAAPGLAPGIYSIRVTHPGFQSLIRNGIGLSAGRTLRLDLRIELGEQRDAIVVESSAPLVSASVADWGGRVVEHDLESLPVNGRDLFRLASLEAGNSISGTFDPSLNNGMGIQISTKGTRPAQNIFQIDGVIVNDSASAAPVSATGQQLGLEAVHELHIVSDPFSAEYGKGAGAVITAVSKSGSNQFHGSLYEYFRNSTLDARNYFDEPGEKKPPLRRNQFGGLLGGPVRRGKVFFLVNYEAVRERLGKTVRPIVPTAEAREGLLPTPDGGVQRIEVVPEVKPYLELYPLPNGADFGDGTAEYINDSTRKTNDDFISSRADVLLSRNWRLFGRYTFDTGASAEPEPVRVWTFGQDSSYHFGQLEVQSTPTPNTITSLHFGVSQVSNQETSLTRDDIPPSLTFVPGQPLGMLRVSGLVDLGGNAVTVRPRRFANEDYQFSGRVTHVRGPHTIRFGAGYDRIVFDQLAPKSAMGEYRFGSLADFLRGRTNSAKVMMPDSDASRLWKHHQFFAYFQDEVRLSSRLNLSLGVRYETATSPSEKDGKVASLRDPLHDEAVTVGGVPFLNPSKRNFAPRAALAYDPFGTGKSIIRIGAGIFFDLLGSRELGVAGVRTPPFYRLLSVRRPPFPDLASVARNSTAPEVIDGLQYDMLQPYVGRWQLSVEQELDRNTVARLSYSGARGVHLLGYVSNINPTRPEILADGRMYFSEGGPKLNPALGDVAMRLSQFNSFYHGLSASLESNWTDRLRVRASYTFSKTIDENSSDVFSDFNQSDRLPTPLNFRQNRGPSDFSLQHVFSANFSYSTPSFGNGAASGIFGRWEIYGIAQLGSGFPFAPEIGFDRAQLGEGLSDRGQRPDFIGAPGDELILGDPSRWFNPFLFALPPEGFYGNLGRGALRGPGQVSLDVALQKRIWVKEPHAISLRAEFFNVANHPNFRLPAELELFSSGGEVLSSAGRITATSSTSRQIQLSLRWQF